jgi:hypothetical protein
MIINKFISVFLLLAGCCALPALAVDLNITGTWDSNVGPLELTQSGSDVTAIQKDPEIAKALGSNMFEAKISDNLLKGRVATILVGDKKLCGTNWANWVDLELTLSEDGNRLEGKWIKNTQSTSVKGCPVTGKNWEPWVLTRNLNAPPVESGKKGLLIGGIALLVLTIVSFLIRSAFVNYLVGSLKRSPDNAGLAGWGLFGGLLFGSAIGCTALAGGSYLTMPVVVGLGVLAMICFGLTVVVSSKK